jgi:hypothetical protein
MCKIQIARFMFLTAGVGNKKSAGEAFGDQTTGEEI